MSAQSRGIEKTLDETRQNSYLLESSTTHTMAETNKKVSEVRIERVRKTLNLT